MTRRNRRRGATLLQVAAIVAISGSVLAAFVPRFLRDLRMSKASEAGINLAEMHRRAASYFATEHSITSGEGDQARTELRTRCLPPPAGPTPELPSVEPIDVDWADGSAPDRASWVTLGFEPDRPVRYRYSYEPASSGCDLRSPEGTYLVGFRAEGDLDGDGHYSIFERRAAVDPATGDLVPLGILYIRDRVE